MAGSCPTDLRSRVLAAVEAGERPEVAARRFAVGRRQARELLAERKVWMRPPAAPVPAVGEGGESVAGAEAEWADAG